MHFTLGCRQQEAELRAGLARCPPAPNPARPGPRSSASPEWRCPLPSFKHHLQEHMPILPSLAGPPVQGCPLRGSERPGKIRGQGRRAEPSVSAAALDGEWGAVARRPAKEPPAAECAAPGPVAPSNSPAPLSGSGRNPGPALLLPIPHLAALSASAFLFPRGVSTLLLISLPLLSFADSFPPHLVPRPPLFRSLSPREPQTTLIKPIN